MSLLIFTVLPSHAEDFTVRNLADYGNVTIMEVSGNYDENKPDGTPNVLPRQLIAREFFKTHKDEYDTIVIFSNFDFKMKDKALAFYLHVKNDVSGIGQEIHDGSALYGSSGKLQGTIDMGNVAALGSSPLDPHFETALDTLAHEVLHRWSAYVRFKDSNGTVSTALLGEGQAHWSFLLDSKGSLQYGNQWQDNGNGTYSSVSVPKYYSPLDLYLMGMIDKTQVPPMLLIEGSGIDPARLPQAGETISGTPHYVTIDDIIAAEGERIPNTKDAQKKFKMAFIYVTAPGTVIGQELATLENIRNAFLTRYSILTNGQSLVQVASTLKEDVPVNPGVRLPATVARTLPPNLVDGVNWLITHQQTDGSWSDFNLTTAKDTAEAVTALHRVAAGQQQIQAGLNWLSLNASNNTDFLSRRIEVAVQGGGDTSALVQELISRRNPDGGWGTGRSFVSNPTDTALALKALSRASFNDSTVIGQAVTYLQMSQNQDGGWSCEDRMSTIQPTAAVVSAFNVFRKSFSLDSNLNRAVSFLTGKQNGDGGFGNSPSTIYDSAMAVISLQEAGADRGITNNGVNYLLSKQSETGSWQESPYQTALAVRAVWQANIDADLSVKADDISFIPAKVTALPTNAVVNAVIWNLGHTDVQQAKVTLYDGGVAPEKMVAEQLLSFPGLSSVTVTFSVPVNDGNEHAFNVVVDPDNLVKESNKNNNSAAKALPRESTFDFEVLAADVTVSPNPADIGKNVAISAKVTNKGTSDAFTVPVRFLLNDFAAPIDVATVIVDIPAGGSVTREINWKASRAGTNTPLTVLVDPLNVFTETNKNNNEAIVPLTVNGSTFPNLMVSYKDIVITPSPANQGGNANVSVQIKNGGFAPATNVKVNCYIGAPDHNGVLLGSRVLPVVNPGESVTASFDLVGISESGDKIIFIRVDPDNAVQEIAEDDNEAFTTLAVLTLPDLAVTSSSIVLTPAMPKDGDTVAISVTVQNYGDQDAADVVIRVNEGATAIGSAVIHLVKGHSQATANIQYYATGQTGNHSITTVVDPDNKLLEYSKGNNSAVKVFGVQDANLWITELYFSPNGDGVKDSTQFSFRLTTPSSVKVIVVNKMGDAVKTFIGGDLENTMGSVITWDGRNDKGIIANDGEYIVKVLDANNTVIGSLSVVLDTNRSPISDAIGSRFSQETNINCGLPAIEKWQWLPDESGILLYIKDGNSKYPTGLYIMSPDGSDIINVTSREWGDGSDPLYNYEGFQDYKLSPAGDKIVFVLKKTFKDRKTNSFVDEQHLTVVDLASNIMTIVESNYTNMQQQWMGASLGYQPVVINDYRFITGYEWTYVGNRIIYQQTLQTLNVADINNGKTTTWLYTVDENTKVQVLTTPTRVKFILSPNEQTLVYTTSYVDYINNSTSYLGSLNLSNGITTEIERDLPFGTIENITWSDSSSSFAYRLRSNNNGGNAYAIKSFQLLGSSRTIYSSQVAATRSQNHNLQWLANEKLLLIEDEGVLQGTSLVLNSTRIFLLNSNETGAVIKLEEAARDTFHDFNGPYISPDRQNVAFVVQNFLHDISDLKTSNLFGEVTLQYSFRSRDDFGGYYGELNSLIWSSDSSRIAFFIWGRGYGTGWNWVPYGVSYSDSCSGKAVVTEVASGKTMFVGAPVPLVCNNRSHNAVFEWQPDDLSFIGGSLYQSSEIQEWNPKGYWFYWPYELFDIDLYNTETGGSGSLLKNGVYASKYAVSPLKRYLIYEALLDPNDVCHPIYNYKYKDFNLKSVSFLNNLTADLRVTKTDSVLNLKGTAQDLNFEGYKLEYADARNPGIWNLIAPPAGEPVVNGLLANWVPPANGSYYIRLTAWDKAGNMATSSKRVSWGSASTSIASLYKSTDFLSPNGDGIKDAVELHYTILASAHLEFTVYDEAGNLVRTFVKDYVSPVNDFISWDGRDDSGKVVPDGKYKIKVLQFEFVVEVDTASPVVNADIGRLSYDEQKRLLYADVTGLVTDKNIKAWQIYYGEGENPQEWHELRTGNDALAKRDDYGSKVFPIQNALIDRFYDQNISWLKGKKFRITAEDFAGNRSTALTGFLEEKLILSKWDGTFVISNVNDLSTNATIPANMVFPGSHQIKGFSTLRSVPEKIVLQYWNGNQWLQTVNATDLTSGALDFVWDSSTLGLGDGYGIRAKMVDSLGGEHYSNVLTTPALFSVNSSCSLLLTAQNALFESLKLLRLQVLSSQDSNYSSWTDYRIYDAVKGDSMPIGEFSPPLPVVKPGVAYQIRMVGTGISGQVHISDPITFPLSCPVKISLNLTSDEANACGELAQGLVSLTAATVNSPSNVSFKNLSYFVQRPEGVQFLSTFDVLRDGWKSHMINTSGLPEGMYPVKAVLSYLDQTDNKMKIADTTAVLAVDRLLPTSRITYPAGSAVKVCPVKVPVTGGEWPGIRIEGAVADNVGVNRYEVYYGRGENPAIWFPAMTRVIDQGIVVNRPIIGNGPTQGAIGTWNTSGLPGGIYSLKLKMVDTSGNMSCTTTAVSFDDAIGMPVISADKPLISPNDDGMADNATLRYQLDRSASVDAKVFNVLDNGKLDILPIAVLASGLQYVSGLQSIMWSGKTDAGTPAPDGRYGMAISASDTCGYSSMEWALVEVDNTPPAVVIGYPKSTDILPESGNIIEVKGTASDKNFQSYTLEAGQGDIPSAWVILSSGTSQINGTVLGIWNTYNLTGRWTLRLSALDRAGNKNITTSTIELGARKALVKTFDVAPKILSPNNDNRLDTTLVSYEVTDSCQMKIDILDTAGTIVQNYSANVASPGTGSYRWDGRSIAGIFVADGTYQVKVTAALLSNPAVTQTETLSVTVDTTSPQIEIKQPADKAYLNASKIGITGTISDPNLLAQSLKVSGPAGLLLQDEGNQSRTDYLFGNIEDLAEGDYVINAEAKDLAENTSSVTRTFTIDRTAPKTALDTPKGGECFGGANSVINVTGSVQEKNLERFSLRYGVGDAPTEWQEFAGGNAVTALPNLYEWKVGNGNEVSDGVYTISLYAKDKAGLESETQAKVTIDNTPPVVAFVSVQDSGYVRKPVDLTGDLKDPNLDKGLLELAEGNCSTAVKWTTLKDFSASVSAGVLLSWKIIPADGEYCLKLSATDKAGNKASAVASIKIDTDPPVSPVLTGKIDYKTCIVLSWPKNSEPDVAGYTIYREGRKLHVAPLTSLNYQDSNLKEGTYSYTVTAVDSAGNESVASNAVSLRIDLTGPAVRITSPQEGSHVSNVIDIKGAAFSSDDFKEYRISIGQGINPMTWNISRTSPLPLSFGTLSQWETTALTDGAYTIRLEGEDLIGNISAQTVSVTVDNTPPSVPVLLSAIAAGADVTLTWRSNTEADLVGYAVFRNDQVANATGSVVANLKPYLVTATSFVDKAVPDGKYRYHVVAVDRAGNASDISNALSVDIDIRPPHTVIVEPTDGTRFEGKILLRADSPDNDIVSNQFQYKKAQDPTWTNLGPPITSRPFVTYFDPKALGLSYGTFQVMSVATDTGGKSDTTPILVSLIYADLTPPAIPAGIQSAVNGNGVTLAWSANADPDLDGYNIYRRTGTTTTKLNSGTMKDTVYQDAGLADGAYGFVITAIDTSGNESKPSDSVSATIYAPFLMQPYTPVAQPSLKITGGGAVANASVELLNTKEVGQTSLGRVAADSQGNFLFDNLTLGAGKNSLTTTATDSTGNISRASDAVVVVYHQPPAEPTGVAATVEGYTASLSWNPNGEPDLAGYNVYREGVKVNATPPPITTGQVSASSSDYPPSQSFDGNPATSWLSSFGYGSLLPEWWEVVLPSQELINRVEINWYKTVSYSYAGKDFEVQAWSGYAWIPLAKVKGNTLNDNSFDIVPPYPTAKIRISISDTNYPNYYKRVGISDVKILKEPLVSQTGYQDLSLRDGRYRYTVAAVNTAGFESPPSAGVPADVGDIIPPATPQGVAAAANGSSAVISWSSPGGEPDLAGYNIYRKVSDGWQKTNPTLVITASYSEMNLINGTYTWHVTAVDNVGNESDPSSDATATIMATLPQPPGNPRVTAVPEGKALIVAWDASGAGVESYSVYRSNSSGVSYNKLATVPSTVLVYQDSGLMNGTQYYYVVTAVDGIGNETVYSNQAFGVPTDTVAPVKPFVYSPVLAPGEVRIYRTTTNVAGTAEPGSSIELFRDGASYGKTVALPSETSEKVHVVFSGFYPALSPDGRYIVYTDTANALIIMDVSSGTSQKIADKGGSAKWSYDGGKVAYRFTDANSNARIGVYDVEAKQASPLTNDQTVSEDMPSWSSDGRKIAYISNRGNVSSALWIKDLVTGNETPTNLVVSNAVISPDGSKVALYKGGTLSVLTLADGATLQIGTNTYMNPLAMWSPDSSKVIFQAYINGRCELYIMDLAAQKLSQVTTDGVNHYYPAWSPDGKSIVYGKTQVGGTYAVWLSDLNGQSRILKSVSLLSAMVWGGNGAIIFYDAKAMDIYIHHLPGQFLFKDVNLDPGENSLTAEATDDGGNAGPPSDPISVVYDTALLPDLSVSSDSIYVYPIFAKPGEDVTVDVIVTNKSDIPVDNVAVDFYSWDPDSELRFIGTQIIPHLNGRAGNDVAVKVNAGQKPGAQTIIINVDPNNNLKELLENNNTSVKEFFVTDKEEVAVDAAADSDQYSSGQDAKVTVTVRNSGSAREGVVNVMIEDAAGNRVASLASVVGNIPYGVNTFSCQWNTGTTFAGLYKVRAVFTATGGTTTESSRSFAIVPDIRVDGSVVTDKLGYWANQIVSVTSSIKNTGSKFVIPQLKLRVRITDSNSSVLVAEEKSIQNVFPGTGSSVNTTWNTGLAPAGSYQAVVETYIADQQVSSSIASFKINPDIAVKGTVTANTTTVLVGNAVKADYTVNNIGNVVTSGVVGISVTDPETQTLIASDEATVNLQVGGTQTGYLTFSTKGLALKSYQLNLQYTRQGSTKNIATANFALKDGVAPVVTIVSPLSAKLYNSKVPVVVLASDDASGVDKVEYQIDAAGWKAIPLSGASNGRYAAVWEADSKSAPRSIYFRVTDRAGNATSESQTINFRPEAAPTAPSLSSPPNGTDLETLTPTLLVNNASDPNDDELSYQFELYSDPGLTHVVATSGTIAAGTGVTFWQVAAALNENVGYFWRARAFDGLLYGAWMGTAAFRVNTFNDPPKAPTPAAPVNGGAVATPTPFLSVNNASDPDSPSLTYNFVVSLDACFSQIVASAQGIFSGEGTTSWQVPVTLQENQQYFWRAQADDWLTEGPWMEGASFFVNSTNEPPTVPTIIAAVGGSEVTTLMLDVAVSNSSDPDSSLLTYIFELDTVPTFDSPNRILRGNVQAGEGTTIWPVADLQDNTRYYLRVKASDSLTESPWSPVSSFFVNTVNDPPAVPVLANPSNGAGVNVFNPVLFIQNATDPDLDPVTYDFELYGDAALTALVSSATGISETSQVTSWAEPVTLEENKTYYWRARAFDGELHSDWTAAGNFTVNTADDPPSAPVLSAPLGASSVATLNPTLAVSSALDPDSRNLTYHFEVYSGNALVSSIPNVPENSSGVTSVTLSTALADNTTYQWRCCAYDGNAFGPWMSMATFSTHIQQAVVNAGVQIEPQTLNKKSNGTWVMAKIVLPRGYKASDIDIASIRFEGVVHAETWPVNIVGGTNGRLELKVKFRRSDVLATLSSGENILVHVIGKVGNVTFEGVDTVKIIH